jgi:hypothetical protein
MRDLAGKSFITRAVHAGEHVPPADFTPVVSPIHPTVGYLAACRIWMRFCWERDGYVYRMAALHWLLLGNEPGGRGSLRLHIR